MAIEGSCWRRRLAFGAFLLAAALPVCFQLGCTGGTRGELTAAEEKLLDREVEVEAFLYDARLKRDGKPTSVRLYVYRTDSIVGLGGRGYLGKGALKGRLTADSLTIYFPSTNEYVEEAVENIVAGKECAFGILGKDLLDVLARLPVDLSLADQMEIATMDDSGDDRRQYELRADGCDWRLALEYRRRGGGWRIEEFDYSDRDRLELTGRLRTFREQASVAWERFVVAMPDDAVRITP